MPVSEKKGRFTVSITEQPKPSVSPSPPPCVSPPSNSSARAVKRGRFLVSCIPCSSPCLAPTLSCEQEGAGLFSSSQGNPQPTDLSLACASRSTCSSDDTRVTGTMDHAAAGGVEVSSPCRDSPAGQGVAPAQSPERRRVTFSHLAAEDQPGMQQPRIEQPALPVLQQQQQQLHASTQAPVTQQGKRQHEQPLVPQQLKPTRSYCRGRFTVQEAVALQGAALHRSISAPECATADAKHSGSSGRFSFQADFSPFATGTGGAGVDNASISSSTSRSYFAQISASSCAELLAANQLMSGVTPLQQHQQQQAAPSTGHFFGAAANSSAFAVAPEGLFASASVPVPISMCSDEDGSIYAALLGLSDCPMSDAAPFQGGLGTTSATSSRHSSNNGRHRGNALSTSSSSNMLSSSCSVGPDFLAAAAAVGHHAHSAPKRSPSVSYFRRGRFLVQTTMV